MSNSRSTRCDNDVSALCLLIGYGMLGGLVGRPVSITFRDFPSDVLSGIRAYISRWIPDDQFAEVWSQVDVQRLRNQLSQIRLVILYPSSGRNPSFRILDWMIERRRAPDESLPSILSVNHPNSCETPGATLFVLANYRVAITSDAIDLRI